MQVLSIGTSSGMENLRGGLERPLQDLSEYGLQVTFGEQSDGSFQLLMVDIQPMKHTFKADPESMFQYHVASALAETIIRHYEENTLSTMAKSIFPELNPIEQREIAQLALELLSVDTSGYHESPQRRKASLEYYLMECLAEGNHINVDGFLRFRPHSYLEALRQGLYAAADRYLAQKEHEQFITLLKYFVELQQPQNIVVNVIVKPNGAYRLLDEYDRIIDNEYLEGRIYGALESQINQEDLLLSALITLSPAKIILHFRDQSELALTICQVFEERVEFCEGCVHCRRADKYLPRNKPPLS